MSKDQENTSTTKASSGPKYIGPVYKTAVILPGYGRAKPKEWAPDKVKTEIERFPALAKFFKF